MKRLVRLFAMLALVLWGAAAHADPYSATVALFKNSSESASFFKNSYGYAVFPAVGKGGFVVACAHGTGRGYAQSRWVGNATVTQVTIGSQIGAQASSQIVFFEDERAFRNFTSGNFEFGADASAVVITAAAQASAGTQGLSAGASGGKNDAGTIGGYHDGMAIFTIVKGGAMVSAAVGGQKFGYTPRRR